MLSGVAAMWPHGGTSVVLPAFSLEADICARFLAIYALAGATLALYAAHAHCTRLALPRQYIVRLGQGAE